LSVDYGEHSTTHVRRRGVGGRDLGLHGMGWLDDLSRNGRAKAGANQTNKRREFTRELLATPSQTGT
jgi:hypothetical protein